MIIGELKNNGLYQRLMTQVQAESQTISTVTPYSCLFSVASLTESLTRILIKLELFKHE